MIGDPHPAVKRTSELIRKYSKAIREAQARQREAARIIEKTVRAAERDYISEEQLYT